MVIRSYHRPDLKQFMMELICTRDGDVLLWMKIGDGNESDPQKFAQAMKEFKKPFNPESLMVADSALYSQENLQALRKIKWLTRVRLRIKAAHNLVLEADTEKFKPSQLAGYSYLELTQNYGGIKQRWLVIYSEKRRESDLKQLEKKVEKNLRECQAALCKLTAQNFAGVPDAERAAEKLLKKSITNSLQLKWRKFKREGKLVYVIVRSSESE